MRQITDLKARRIAPGNKPVADSIIKGLRLEPGSAEGQAYPDVGVATARTTGSAARQMIAGGKDPIDDRKAARAANAAIAGAMTFEEAARQVHQGLKPGWKNPKHRDQWINTLRDYAFPKIGKRKVADLVAADFAEILRPLWLAKPETASRVKQRCHTVMKWCWAHELVKGNPVDVVDHLLPQQPGKREQVVHQPSMPWRDIPTFVQGVLRLGPSNVTRALLEFVILTAARSGEARAMTWDEVNLEAKVWTLPANRMKARVVHRVPLSERAVEILARQRELHPETDLVFPAPRGGVLSDMVLTGFLRDQKAHSSDKGRVATAHGFRSSFRDWASESGYARDLAERALAHTVKNQAEAAYHRTDLIEQRRAMMEAWAQHIGGFAAAG